MPPFDEGEVKTGNISDPWKKADKIADRRAAHEANWLAGASLRPETGKILAIGALGEGSESPLLLHVRQSNEAEIIKTFWEFLQSTQQMDGQAFCGWSIFHFDLPFLVIRSRILGVALPPQLRQGRYFNPARFMDLQDDWLLGRSRYEVTCSLDYVARALGCGGKAGEGKDFGPLYASDEKAALEYLSNDLAITQRIARKLGVMQ